MMKNIIYSLVLVITFYRTAFCQEQKPLHAPRITVIPFIKEGEDMQAAFKDTVVRAAVSSLNEAFDKRGLTTISFPTGIKTEESVYDSIAKADGRIIPYFNYYSNMDVYIEVGATSIITSSGNQAAVTLTAYEGATGNIVASKKAQSMRFTNQNFAMMASKAVASVSEEFLNELQLFINDWQENGKTILFEVKFSKESKFNPDTKIDSTGLTFAATVDVWLAKNAFKSKYETKEKTKDKLQYYVRIPLRDSQTGSNYTINKFGLSFHKYCLSVGVECIRDVRGNRIFATIK